MRSTLLIRLAGPMQSWGTESRFSIRDTGKEPSKSGVVGLVCCALGKPREERDGDGFPPLSQLAGLRMGVRVNREGSPDEDFHTAGASRRQDEKYGVAKADGSGLKPVVSRRHFLSDADFLAGLESEDADLLRRLHEALRAPHWPLSLGRKAFVPSVPVYVPDGLRLGVPLEEALGRYPLPPEVTLARGYADAPVRVIIDAAGGEDGGEVRQDVPLSFETREFTTRLVRSYYVEAPAAVAAGAEERV